MKKYFLIITMMCVGAVAYAQEKIYSIVTCPAEDPSQSMNISWAAEEEGSYVLYAPVNDKNWRKVSKAIPQERLCTTYDSIYSKAADGKNIYERVRFTKCDATLTHLKAGTEYKYRIYIKGKAESEEYRFKTAGKDKWSAYVISDFHTYTPLPKRLDAAMAMMDRLNEYDKKGEWTLHLGDVTAWGGSYSFWKAMYEKDHFKKYMWAGVNGNHDNMTRVNGQSHEFFRDANFYPRNGYAGQEGVCYHFTYGGVLFIMLNNEAMHKVEGQEAAKAWVEKVVKENPARYVVVCEHYQWFMGANGKASHYARWSELFDRLGVDLALAGNNHIYVRTAPVYAGKETDGTKGTVYLQTPSSDNERGVSCPPEFSHNTDIIKYRWAEGGQTVGGVHMDVNKKRMVLTLLDRNGNVLDKATVLAKKK
jgi:hypothetical protein